MSYLWGFTVHEHTWRKDLILPVLRCSECQTLHHESDDKLTPLSQYIADRDSGPKRYGYQGVFSGIILALIGPGVPILGLISWILMPFMIGRDTRYVRSNSERNPATRYWVWAAIFYR